MELIRKCIQSMSGYVPGEQPDDPEIIKLNQNENNYPPSPRVAEAMRAAFDNLALYPDSTSKQVREVAAKVYQTTPGRVMVTNGSDEMLRILFQACCDEGSEAVSFRPGYTYYKTLADIQNVRYRLIDLENGVTLPKQLDLAEAKLVFLPNPNAITGVLFPEDDIRRLLDTVRNGVVCIDEAYADFAGVTVIPLLDEYPHLVVARTFSKSYSLAGLRVGLGFAREELMAEFDKVRDYYNLDRAAQAGAEAALADQETLESNCRRIVATRNRLTASLRSLGLSVYDSSANFVLARFDSPQSALAAMDTLKRNKIYVRHFGTPGWNDCLRITVGTDREIDRLLAVLTEK